jgi:ribonuclease G
MENITRAVRKDRSKTIIVGWTKLGLLEMTRKRKK